ncbi:NIPSNAP family protein [Xenorhabdus lircayensis]|uniref:NIPSNAP family protein n=1 Tax=Xenorhabdus lircayensis TaxID=2763499 RepID=A0ABS0UD53_9GAMM|nr:NIPSNAP family protein [Xenorhabdus lircayensis]MBI6550590.1 NIPSNAP family protein [Xenorhabdus lircayensis]
MDKKIIEILQYELKTGTGEEFHRIMMSISVPLHRKNGIDVVSYGNSLHDLDSYYLIRAFDNFDEMHEILTEFYKSSDWIKGPRADIIERMDKSVKSIIELPVLSIDALRGSNHIDEVFIISF